MMTHLVWPSIAGKHLWPLLFCVEKFPQLRIKLNAFWEALNLCVDYASKCHNDYVMFTSAWTASILTLSPFNVLYHIHFVYVYVYSGCSMRTLWCIHIHIIMYCLCVVENEQLLIMNSDSTSDIAEDNRDDPVPIVSSNYGHSSIVPWFLYDYM